MIKTPEKREGGREDPERETGERAINLVDSFLEKLDEKTGSTEELFATKIKTKDREYSVKSVARFEDNDKLASLTLEAEDAVAYLYKDDTGNVGGFELEVLLPHEKRKESLRLKNRFEVRKRSQPLHLHQREGGYRKSEYELEFPGDTGIEEGINEIEQISATIKE